MQEIIILILFTYPGVLADFIHLRLVSGKVFETHPDNLFRTARDFFLSALISMISCFCYSQIYGMPFSIYDVAERIQKGNSLWIYLVLSVVFSIITGYAWLAADRIRFSAGNKMLERTGKPTQNESASVWDSLMTDPAIPYKDSVIAIYTKERKLIRAGETHCVTDDPEKDPWIILKFTELAEQQLSLPPEERTLLYKPHYSFIDIKTGLYYDLYDGKKFGEYIDAWLRSSSALRDPLGDAKAEAPADF